MNKYEMLDEVMSNFTPKELAEYLYMNDRCYALDVNFELQSIDMDRYYCEDLDSSGQMIMFDKCTNIEIGDKIL